MHFYRIAIKSISRCTLQVIVLSACVRVILIQLRPYGATFLYYFFRILGFEAVLKDHQQLFAALKEEQYLDVIFSRMLAIIFPWLDKDRDNSLDFDELVTFLFSLRFALLCVSSGIICIL